jgi:hypothetical protein
MPIDTAVAAMISEIASAAVASSSTRIVCLRENFRAVAGEVKPIVPVSSVMAVILGGAIRLRRSATNQLFDPPQKSRRMQASGRPDLGEAVEKQRRFRDFG